MWIIVHESQHEQFEQNFAMKISVLENQPSDEFLSSKSCKSMCKILYT